MGEFRVLVVPYELGRLREGVGCGPEVVLAHGAVDALAAEGASVRVEVIEIDDWWGASGTDEVGAAFALVRLVADRVRCAREEDAFPVVLAGSCLTAVGVIAGLAEPAPGVVWFDAHADFNEPSTTLSGYLDGMGLAVLTGGAWQGMLAAVPSAQPVPEARVVLAGARDYDPPEEARLRASQVVQVPAERLSSPEALVESIEAREEEVSGLYLHVDLDVLDADVARVNVHSAPDGINGDQLDDLVAALTARFPVRAVSLTAFDPAYDVDVHVPPIALQLLRTIARILN